MAVPKIQGITAANVTKIFFAGKWSRSKPARSKKKPNRTFLKTRPALSIGSTSMASLLPKRPSLANPRRPPTKGL